MVPLTEFLVPYSGTVFTGLGIFIRLSAFVIMLPGLGESSVPVRIRLMIAFVMTAMVLPMVLTENKLQDATIADIGVLYVSELIYGFVLGFALRIMVWVLQIAGTIIAQAMSLSQILGASLTEEPNTTVSNILLMAGVTLAVTLDLHVEALGLFVQSYEVFPFGSLPDLGGLAEWAAERSVWAFAFALSLSLPFVVLNFIYNVALGMISRAMPQLMVSFVGIPAITGAGLVLFALSVTTMLLVWLAQFDAAFLQFEAVGP